VGKGRAAAAEEQGDDEHSHGYSPSVMPSTQASAMMERTPAAASSCQPCSWYKRISGYSARLSQYDSTTPSVTMASLYSTTGICCGAMAAPASINRAVHPAPPVSRVLPLPLLTPRV